MTTNRPVEASLATQTQYLGFEKRDALPVPVEYLGDLEARIEMGVGVEVPESIVIEGIKVRKLINQMADKVGERYSNAPNMGASRIRTIEDVSRQLLADFYVEQRLLEDDVEIEFLAGEIILPVADPEDDDGTAGVGAKVNE